MPDAYRDGLAFAGRLGSEQARPMAGKIGQLGVQATFGPLEAIDSKQMTLPDLVRLILPRTCRYSHQRLHLRL